MSQSYKGWTVEKLISVEKEIQELFKAKKIRHMFHLSGGNEQALIDLFADNNIDNSCWCFSTHRSHYHALLKGMSPDELVNRVVKGESMHLYSKELKLFSSAIVGGVLPIALGVAMAIKMKRLDEMVWVFVGDMCASIGVFHECLLYAKGHQLPITFVVEDNSYGINTKTLEAWGAIPGEWSSTYVRYYKYDRTYPHAGSGDFVNFDV
jgi:TPP-dependent pyruvate/acetoin dehydrogenase alpha subunit